MVRELSAKARKRSDDPSQESLREAKSKWNDEKKLFIAQVIAFGRGFNGKGDARAGLPTSDIKYPFPPEITQYLEDMTRRFERLVTDARHIVDMQAEYSKNRRKGKKDTHPGAMSMVATNEFMLDKQGATRFSRWWAWVTQYPWFREDQATKDRIALMYSLADFKNQINDIEDVLGSTDKNALAHSFYSWIKFSALFNTRFRRMLDTALDRHLELFKEKVENKENIGAPPPRPTPGAEEEKEDLKRNKEENQKEEDQSLEISGIEQAVIAVQNDLEKALIAAAKIKTLINLDKIKPLGNGDATDKYYKNVSQKAFEILMMIRRNEGDVEIKEKYSKLIDAYVSFMQELSRMAGLSGPVGTIAELMVKLQEIEKQSYGSPAIEKLAKKKVRRWLQRLRLSLHTDELNRFKLDTTRKLKDLDSLMDSAQDLLQSPNTIIVEVIELIIKIYGMIADLCYDFSIIGRYHNAALGEERSKKRKPTAGAIPTTDISYTEKTMNKFLQYAAQLESKVKAL